jgi:hypothetical protein
VKIVALLVAISACWIGLLQTSLFGIWAYCEDYSFASNLINLNSFFMFFLIGFFYFLFDNSRNAK